MKLNQKVKAIREDKKLSQSFLAHELGLDQSQYSRREKGEIQFIPEEIIKLSHLLDTTISDLFNQRDINIPSNLTNMLIEQYELRLKEKDELIKVLNQKLNTKTR